MINPVLGIRLAIQRSRLNINSCVCRVIVDIADGSCLSCRWRLDGYTFEVGGCDEVDVLAGVGEESHPMLRLVMERKGKKREEKVAYIDIATKLPIAPESSLPGSPAFVGLK
jgi:hypothetical protein